ncbi:MAG: FAD-dependent monooxygenase [Gemmatimonadaceae bacterium]
MTVARHDAEVIVVGGGPAGSSISFFLARAGVDVLVVDRAQFPRDKPCSEYLSPQASRILYEMGMLERVEAAGAAQLTGMRVHAPNGSIIHGEFAATHGFRGFRDRGLALRRTILDAMLLSRARESGARVNESVAVRSLLTDGARGRVTGVVIHDGRTTRELRAPLVIGADGLRSVIARRLGLARVGRWPRRMALVAHYSGVEGVGNFGEMYVDPEGYTGFADVGSGVTNVAVVVPASQARDMAGDTDGFMDRWLRRRPLLHAKVRDATRFGSVKATGPFNSRARRAWAPGAALVGDAADFFDPFTGEGIYAALRGGELLTSYAFDVARATNSRKADVALAAWDRCLRDEFKGKRLVERAIGIAVAFPSLLDRAARSLSARRELADLLVGVTGDFVPASEVLRPSFVARLLFPQRPDSPPAALRRLS